MPAPPSAAPCVSAARRARWRRIPGRSMDGNLVEIVEIPSHPWFVGVQFHPEFTSTPRQGHPLFTAFVRAALAHQESGKGAPVTPIRQAAS